MSLNNYMPPENRKKSVYASWVHTMYKNNIKKNMNLQNVLRNAKQEFSCKSLENFSGEYYSLGNKILDFQFEPVCAKQTCPNYKKLPRKQPRKQKSSITNGVHIEAATRGVLWKKVFLENFAKFTGKHHCQSLFFNKVAGQGQGLQLY